MVLFIDWQPDMVALDLGFLQLRWYSLMWCIGLFAAYLIVQRLYKQNRIEQEKFEPLFFYCFIGVLIGARLGHCIFYEPGQYLTSVKGFVEMLVPIRFLPDGDWRFTGYEGLASHGGTIGLFIALIIYCRQMKMKSLLVLDFIAVAAPFTSCCIRIGNLMNSEIIGNPTDMPWGFIFHTRDALVDGALAPRHPAQLYEAIAYFIIGIIGVWLYKVESGKLKVELPSATKAGSDSNSTFNFQHSTFNVGSGFYFGYCLAAIFTFRFFVEFLKKEQVDFEQGMLLDMGQILSIPIVLVGAWCMVRSLSRK